MTKLSDQRSEFEKLVDRMVLRRVQAGIRLMEEQFGPDWVEKGEEVWRKHGFDIRSGEKCVIGGVYGRYGEGCELLGIESDPENAGEATVSEMGFNIFAGEYLRENPDLMKTLDNPSPHDEDSSCFGYVTNAEGRERNADTIVWDLLQAAWERELIKRGAPITPRNA